MMKRDVEFVVRIRNEQSTPNSSCTLKQEVTIFNTGNVVLASEKPISKKTINSTLASPKDIPHLTSVLQDKITAFTFDGVEDETITKDKFYMKNIQPLVKDLLLGKSSTVICFGPSESGKTHTFKDKQGCILKSTEDILNQINKSHTTELKISMHVVYDGRLYDLINNSKNVEPIELEELSTKQVKDIRDVQDCLKCAEKREKVLMIEEKDEGFKRRSHYVVLLTLKKKTKEKEVLSRMQFVKLADTEQAVDRTKPKIAKAIASDFNNLSIRLLNHALLKDKENKSKLEKVLKLSTNNKVLFLCFVNPQHTKLKDSLAALKFSHRILECINKKLDKQSNLEANNKEERADRVESGIKRLEEISTRMLSECSNLYEITIPSRTKHYFTSNTEELKSQKLTLMENDLAETKALYEKTLEELNQKNKLLEEQLAAKTTTLRKVEAEVEKTKEMFIEELNATQTEVEKLKEQIEQYETDQRAKNNDTKNLEEELRKENEILKAEAEMREEKLTEKAQAQISKLQRKLEEVQGKFIDSERNTARLTKQVKEKYEINVIEANGKVSKLELALKAAKEKSALVNKELREEINRLTNEREKAATKLEEAIHEITTLHKEYNRLKQVLEANCSKEVGAIRKELENKLKVKDKRIKELEDELNIIQSQKAEMQNKDNLLVEELKQSLAETKKQNMNLKEDNEKLLSELQIARNENEIKLSQLEEGCELIKEEYEATVKRNKELNKVIAELGMEVKVLMKDKEKYEQKYRDIKEQANKQKNEVKDNGFKLSVLQDIQNHITQYKQEKLFNKC